MIKLDTTTGLVTLTGTDATSFAECHGLDDQLVHLAEEGDEDGDTVSLRDATKIAEETPERIRLRTEPRHFLARWASDAWGVPVTLEEHEAACQRATDYLTEHEGDALSIAVTTCSTKRHEIDGVYRIGAHSSHEQILGGSISVPEDVRDLLLAAYEHACKTWPKDYSRENLVRSI